MCRKRWSLFIGSGSNRKHVVFMIRVEDDIEKKNITMLIRLPFTLIPIRKIERSSSGSFNYPTTPNGFNIKQLLVFKRKFKTKCWRSDQQRWSQDRGSLNLWTHQWNAWHPSCEIEFDCHLWIFKIAIRPIEMFRRNTECLHQCGLEYAQDKIFNIHTWDSMCLHGGFVTKWLKWNLLKSTLQNIQWKFQLGTDLFYSLFWTLCETKFTYKFYLITNWPLEC